MSARIRGALIDYLKVVRSGGWLAKDGRRCGSLPITTALSNACHSETAMQAWRTFLQDVGVSEEY